MVSINSFPLFFLFISMPQQKPLVAKMLSSLVDVNGPHVVN